MIRFATRDRRPSVLARSAQLAVAALLAFGLIVVAAWAAAPVPSFTWSPTDPVVGEQVTFTSTSTDPDNDIIRTRWDTDNDGSFDDGTTTGGGPSTATRTFTSTGTKTVRIEVRDSSGTTRTASRQFTVSANGAPVPNFTVSPESPLTNEQVTLTSTSTDPEGRPLTIGWDLNDNNVYGDASGSPVTVSFPENGDIEIGIQVRDSGGTVRTLRRTITVRNRLPIASFNVSSESVDTGQPIQFTSTSDDPDGEIEDTDWDFDNDGQFDDGSGTSLSRSFPDNGTLTIRMRVTDDDDATETATRQVTINNRLPAASIDVSDSEVDTHDPITFSANASDPDGQIASRAWDLDEDGEFDDASGSSVTHSFADNGTPTVSLLVTDDDGGQRTVSRQVTIRNRAPVAAFDSSSDEVDTGDPVVFESTSTDLDGQVTDANWDLDNDGEFDDASGDEVTHSFADDGTATIALEVIDDDGASQTTSRQVTVRNRAPVASFTYSPNAPFVGDEVVLTSTSSDRDGEVEELEWDLDDDGQFDDAEGEQASVSFDEPGSYQVGLRVRDDDDRTSTTFDTIDVTTRPDPSAPNPPGGGSGGGGDTGNAIGRRALVPFPSIRIRGMTTATGARIDLLSVRTPGGTRILVRCKGGSCPFARRRLRARFGESRVRTLRLPGFNRRHVRAGTVIEIFVIDDGVVGKYTRFVIRRGLRAPRRVDRCTVPGRFRARRCPG